MKFRFGQQGFTLIELMIVVLIIGIFCAIAVPHMIEVNRRNKLTDLVTMVQSHMSETRARALETRRAVVFEHRNDAYWINLLQGGACTSQFAQRCLPLQGAMATTGAGVFVPFTPDIVEAETVACGGTVQFVGVDGKCGAPVALPANGTYALCYSGRGELWYRGVDEPQAACTVNTPDPTADVGWKKTCGAGAELLFNRFKNRVNCSNTDCVSTTNTARRDICRQVVVPVVGAPYSKVKL